MPTTLYRRGAVRTPEHPSATALVVGDERGTECGLGTAVGHRALVVGNGFVAGRDRVDFRDRPLVIWDRCLIGHGHLRGVSVGVIGRS